MAILPRPHRPPGARRLTGVAQDAATTYPKFMKQPDQSPPSKKELTDARAALTAQLDVLRNPYTYRVNCGGPPDNRSIIAVLERQLAEIEEVLAAMKPNDT